MCIDWVYFKPFDATCIAGGMFLYPTAPLHTRRGPAIRARRSQQLAQSQYAVPDVQSRRTAHGCGAALPRLICLDAAVRVDVLPRRAKAEHWREPSAPPDGVLSMRSASRLLRTISLVLAALLVSIGAATPVQAASKKERYYQFTSDAMRELADNIAGELGFVPTP